MVLKPLADLLRFDALPSEHRIEAVAGIDDPLGEPFERGPVVLAHKVEDDTLNELVNLGFVGDGAGEPDEVAMAAASPDGDGGLG